MIIAQEAEQPSARQHFEKLPTRKNSADRRNCQSLGTSGNADVRSLCTDRDLSSITFIELLVSPIQRSAD
jgi:hypothetical protein